MKTEWNKSWKGSKQPRKQRKYIYNIPLHLARKLMSSHLAKDLIKKYGKRNVPVRKGDLIKIMVGQFKGKTGKIDKVDAKHRKVYVEGIYTIKRDGTKMPYPIHPSNLLIISLEASDKVRRKVLERK